MGRPRIGDRLDCRFPDDDREVVRRLAEENGISEAEVARRLVRWAIKKLGLRHPKSLV
jgi:hypothetical protein